MAHGRPERVCIPLETELQPLYRDPPGTARLRRELKRARRGGAPTFTQRVLARLGVRRRNG